MLDQIIRYDSNWRNHHRRFMDEPSILKQIIEISIILAALVLLLMLLP